MKRKISIMLVLCMIFSAFAGLTTVHAEIDYSKPITSYVDVPESHWSYEWVSYMSERNYIHGYPVTENDGQHMYKPDQWITRAEFASILLLMLNPQGEMSETFVDVSTTDWFYKCISKAVATGYLSGYGDGTMRPNRYITREEASCVIYNAFKIKDFENETDFLDKDEISSWAYKAVMSLADIGIVAGYTGATEDERYVSPKVNIKRAEVAAMLANADKFYPATVTLSDAEIEFDSKTGGSISFDMFPKNTSDNLSVRISEMSDIPFTVTYSLDGKKTTVTAEEFEKLTFTADELGKLQIELNFEDVEEGSQAEVVVEVTDKGESDDSYDDKLAGWARYRITFKKDAKPITGGGPSTTYYKVTYDTDNNGADANDPTESVASGNKPTSVPQPSGTAGEVYIWEDANGSKVNPLTVTITADTTFKAVATDYDRVIIALKAYQAMKGDGTSVATVNTLVNAPYGNTDVGYTNGNDAHNNDHTANVWWTTDMLEIIVTNDKNHLLDGVFTGVTAQATLKPIYDDVARYVIDNSTEFDGEVTPANKLEYVKFFRAMVKTIDAAAVNAAEAYDDARKNGGNRDTAYTEFKQQAVLLTASSLVNALDSEGVTNDALVALALGYVQALYDSADAKEIVNFAIADANAGDGLKAKLDALYTANPNLADFKTAVAIYIASQHIYAK